MIYVFAVPQAVPRSPSDQLTDKVEGKVPLTALNEEESNEPVTSSNSKVFEDVEDLDHLHTDISDEEMDDILDDVEKEMTRYADTLEMLDQTQQVDLGVLLGAYKMTFEERKSSDVLDYLKSAIEHNAEDPISFLAGKVKENIEKESTEGGKDFATTYAAAIDQVDDQFRDEVEEMIASDGIGQVGEDILGDVEVDKDVVALSADING